MCESPTKVRIDNLAADQIGIVVNDIEEGMDRFAELLGIDQWSVYRFEPPTLTDRTYYGDEGSYSMVLATTIGDGAMVELIEPLEGPNLYATHLENEGEGLHHIGTFVEENMDSVVEQFEGAGLSVIQGGSFGDVEFRYIDTRNQLTGVLVELIANIEDAPQPDRIYTPEG